MNKIPYVASMLFVILTGLSLAAAEGEASKNPSKDKAGKKDSKKAKAAKVIKHKGEWRKILTPTQFYVCREKGTERAFSGAYWNEKTEGTYHCVCCNQELFSSTTKYKSGTGWPSFWAPITKEAVSTATDTKLRRTRVEILCSRCDSHLGHVFSDGPKPTGQRYCVNSASLKLVPKEKPKEAKATDGKKEKP